jgi:hypothetical protein
MFFKTHIMWHPFIKHKRSTNGEVTYIMSRPETWTNRLCCWFLAFVKLDSSLRWSGAWSEASSDLLRPATQADVDWRVPRFAVRGAVVSGPELIELVAPNRENERYSYLVLASSSRTADLACLNWNTKYTNAKVKVASTALRHIA